MKKIIVASFQFEACGLSKILPTEADFEYFQGEGIFKKLVVREKIVESGFTPVPSIYANALPGGILPLRLYNKFKNQIIDTVRNNTDAVGIYIYFHGSMEVESIGSGELQLIKEIRQIIGTDALISISMDLHANVTKEIIPLVDIVCGYKSAPHIDQDQTQLRSIEILLDALKSGKRPITQIIKVPMLIAGDTMITAIEPLKTLIAQTIEYEKNESICSVNLFFAHMWVDAPNTMASVIVTAFDKDAGINVAKDMANAFWESRTKYKFLVETGGFKESSDKALEFNAGRVFISDSGDNTTAGADGDRIDFLEYFTKVKSNKKVCVSGITNEDIIKKCQKLDVGSKVYFLGKHFIIKNRGKILGWAKEIIGDSMTLAYGNTDVIFTDKRSAFISKENFEVAGNPIEDYDVIVVKLGYLFEELLPYCDKHFFAFTEGSSCVDIKRLNLKRINRPMYPLDKDIVFKA